MRIPLAVGLHVLLTVAVVEAQTPSPEEAVARALAGFADSWNRHDMKAFGEGFAADADFVNVTAQWWKGHESLTFTSTVMRVGRPDLAVGRAEWQMTGDLRTAETRSGVMMLVVATDSKIIAVPTRRGPVRSDRDARPA